jgi:hypothetical protein
VVLSNGELPIQGQLHLEPAVLKKYKPEAIVKAVENFSFKYGYSICGHCTLDKEDRLLICTNAAGLHTQTPGKGRCYNHIYAGDIIPLAAPQTPYSRELQGYTSLQQIFEEFQNRGKEAKQLDEELAMTRTVLAAQLKNLNPDKPGRNEDTYRMILLVLEQIRRIADTMSKISASQSQGITIDSITAFLWQLQAIMGEEIHDPMVKLRLFDRISTECSFLNVIR